MIQFSALAKHKIELLNVHLTVVWGEETFNEFIANLENSLSKVEKDPTSFPTIISKHLRICEVNEDTSFVYQQINNKIVVVTFYDYRQNPILVYNDLIEYFHED